MDEPLHDAEILARKFHGLYESLAPQFGYLTNEETREFDPTSKNGRLMIAVCHEILADRHEQLESALAEKEKENAELSQRLRNWNCGANSMTVYAHEETIAQLREENAALREEVERLRGKNTGPECLHKGYSFNLHGRCCPHCGEFMQDFGD